MHTRAAGDTDEVGEPTSKRICGMEGRNKRARENGPIIFSFSLWAAAHIRKSGRFFPPWSERRRVWMETTIWKEEEGTTFAYSRKEEDGGEEDRITSMLPKCLFLFLSISPTRSGAAYWSKRQSTLFPFPRVYFPFATPTHVRGTESPFLLLPHNTHHGKKRGGKERER